MTDAASEGRSIAAARLLGYSGYRGPFALVPLPGGKNNRVFRVDLAEESLVLKAYYQHPGDPRDRLGAEYGFSTFAWGHGLRTLPQPLACDAENRLALYEFIPGRRLTADEVSPDRVSQAAAFFRQLNELVTNPEASRLPAGSEACFRLADLGLCLARRRARLEQMEPASAVDRDAAAFIARELAPLCASALDAAREQSSAMGLAPEAELPPADRCLSPSDFGFHNALCTENGELKFLDFEYAGWDDPAKAVCDFFCQPELPVPRACFDAFAAAVTSRYGRPELHRQRIDLLLPIYRLKWCCIMLNDFLPAGNQRRQYAGTEGDESERKARQLAKARSAAAFVAETLEIRAAA